MERRAQSAPGAAQKMHKQTVRRSKLARTAGYRSVGKESDCRCLQQSNGPWFDSGSPDFAHVQIANPVPTATARGCGKHAQPIARRTRTIPAIAHLAKHVIVDACTNRMVPGSIPGGRIRAGHNWKILFRQRRDSNPGGQSPMDF